MVSAQLTPPAAQNRTSAVTARGGGGKGEGPGHPLDYRANTTFEPSVEPEGILWLAWLPYTRVALGQYSGIWL